MNESNSVKEDVDLVREVESLKNENKALTGKITDLELTLVKKKREAKTLLENSEKQKESLLELVSEENDLVQEIEFYASEMNKMDKIYADVSAKYEDNMGILEGMIKNVGFLKGEIGALVLQMGMLEEEIPERYRDADNLDKKIKGTFVRALNDLQNRVDVVEKKAKVLYYQKEKI
ncbi:MAG: hypothetical protein HN366_24550 [Deltaproteobacteria bacterium]|jgi:hypothetical protein|nr:hypothetical protein [Deltaproteobacteria bacterium]